MIEQLMQEWKVGDFAVAESIFKSRQRQLKQKSGAHMRQKMQVGHMFCVCIMSGHGLLREGTAQSCLLVLGKLWSYIGTVRTSSCM